MRQVNMLLSLVIMIMLAGCGGDGKAESSEAYSYLKNKGYQNVKWHGDGVQYVLNEEMLTRMPDMVEWGLMEGIDPADYIGKTIEVERFKAIGSLAIEGEFIASVFLTDGKPIGGTETVVDINGDGMFTEDGMFSLPSGKPLRSISGKSFEEWQRDWLDRYGG
ncbi:hypothetical protein [Paenibacillus arenilitoris]|uniref:Lipoprotein n=1 Tax=Paenibacillus arenilitoris TaxID=2772299 RepID=A0A927CNY1_9BACL|nr:hypothetical protein [Paenibacillus arenilitoris]MBD2870367.1 hypothetical protein [Paenibacillus arenilitoris]